MALNKHVLIYQDVNALKKLVQQGEHASLEFKRKAANPDKIVREMIAFANSQGGILLVGIGDDKTIHGLKYPDGESHVIKKALENCSPLLVYHESFIEISKSLTVIQYEIPPSLHKPHVQIIDNTRAAYIRVNDQSIKASKEVREILKRSNANRDIKIFIREHEQTLFQYLDKNPSITLQQFITITGLRKHEASRKLILFVLGGILKISPEEKEDRYSLLTTPSH
jgi:predicted HTH transcriptional regulator